MRVSLSSMCVRVRHLSMCACAYKTLLHVRLLSVCVCVCVSQSAVCVCVSSAFIQMRPALCVRLSLRLHCWHYCILDILINVFNALSNLCGCVCVNYAYALYTIQLNCQLAWRQYNTRRRRSCRRLSPAFLCLTTPPTFLSTLPPSPLCANLNYSCLFRAALR